MTPPEPEKHTFPKLIGTLVIVLILGYWILPRYPINLVCQFTSQDWPSYEGTITKCEIKGFGTKTSLKLAYQYTVDDTKHEASRYSFAWLNVKTPRSRAKNLPVGTPVQVFVDPKNPKNAVLHPGINWADLLISPLIATAIVYAIGRMVFLVTRSVISTGYTDT